MNRYFQKCLWAFACAAALLTGACSDDKTDDGKTTVIPPTIEVTGIPDTGMHFLYYAIPPQTFTMTVDAPWEITKTAGWFVVTPKQGKAGEAIEITVTGDFNDGAARDGEFTIKANSGNNLYPSYTEKTIQLKQDACNQAGIVITGLPSDEDVVTFPAEQSDPLTISVTATYDWSMTVTDESWIAVAPKNGKAGVATQVQLTPTPNTEFETHTSQVTISAGDPAYPENSVERIITLAQLQPSDSHAIGYVFFEDDFSWTTQNWIETYSKYGWPSVNVNGSTGNEFALSNIKTAVDAVGYTHSASVYARYEGSVKLGKTNLCGYLQTPALTGIDAGKSATLLVSFYGAIYSSAGGTVDSAKPAFPVSIEGAGTFADGTSTESQVLMNNNFSWTKYSFIVRGATSATKIKLGDEDTKTYRIHIDNIRIEKAADDAEAPAAEPITIPLATNITPQSFDPVAPEGSELTCSIHINRAWSATSDSEWLTIEKVHCGTAANGSSVASDKLSVTVRATWLPYNNTVLKVAANSGTASRTAKLTLTIDGETSPLEMTITQEGATVAAPTITVTGLTDLTVPTFAASATQPQTFTVNADHDWTIDVPPTDTWYSVSPLLGSANTDVTVTVTPTVNSGGKLDGSFEIKAGITTKTIIVSQEASASARQFKWSFTATAEADGLVNKGERWYKSDDGKARIDGMRSEDPASSSANMSYTLASDGEIGRILLYGFALNDYWQFTLPVENLTAGTKFNLNTIISSSGSGPKFYVLEHSTNGTQWNAVNTKTIQDKATSDSELRSITYTYMVPDSPANADLVINEDFTIPTAVANGNVYLRLRVCDAMAANKAKNIIATNGGTTRIKAKEGLSEAISITEVSR
ncbi:BACON domain-containing carbohydrate-binding protein [uncultured Alistipes sp.]|jgi:lipoprotein|uniref:BACON domain-containing protein n=1 Tax=uncultured Alistipes sp. TaxID=538949 RepID=UPI0025FDF4A5|nr:BACON domain-containing carbohydrate-binding protein [uncultured Alistipes sp.]